MLFSYRLLSEYVDLDGLSPKDVASRLTFSGFEVESLRPVAEASSLVIGQIIEERPHPDSDHLHLLKVDCGPEGILDIVCGAPNARKGLKVIVALPGCDLPAIGETIRVGTIRGIPSHGMCCSLAELGVDRERLDERQLSGIEELPADAPVGERQVLSYLGLDDWILDVNVLPNRPDCLSVFGLARELSSLFERRTRSIPLPLSLPKSDVEVRSETSACPRFDVLSLTDLVPLEETPVSVRRALEASGIRPLNPIVDLGNYAMLLTGQPVNLYDARQVPNRRYLVREDMAMTFPLFDGRKVDLVAGDLVVTDGERPLCLAGIAAGALGMVTGETKAVDIEMACFYHKNIRHTSARLGLSSFSSQLFCKERNPFLIPECAATILALLPLFFRSWKVVGLSSFSSLEESDRSFPFSLERLNHRLGSDFTMEEVDRVLRNIRVRREGDRLFPPVDRVDLTEQCDIDEEVFRYYPADRIVPSLEHFPVSTGGLHPSQKAVRRLEDLLRDRGYLQSITYTLVDEETDRSIRVFSDGESFRVQNPMTRDHEIVRSDLLPSLLMAVNRNRAKQKNDVRLFEISPLDTPKGECLYLGLAEAGSTYHQDRSGPLPCSYLSMKGTVTQVLSALGLGEGRYQLVPSTNPAFNPLASADVFVGRRKVGTFGFLSPELDKDECVLCELDLGALFTLSSGRTKAKDYPSFAPVRRDLSLRWEEGVSFADIRRVLLRLPDSHISDVHLFDLFVDKDGSRYLGLSLSLSSDRKALTEKEIAADLEKATGALRDKLGLTLRGA